jgi:3-oxoacyl-[acyl-carrier protein] reductase
MSNKPVIFITGSRKGIGRFLVEYYAKKGFQVIGCSRQSVDFELENYHHFCLDVSDESNVKKAFSEIRRTYQRLDILINNASVNLTLAPVLLVPYQSASKTMETNFLGTYMMSREAVKLMKKNSFGRIINFGSMATKFEVKGEAIYTASKAAVIAFTRVFAKEVFYLGVTCNVIAPSAIETDLMKSIDREVLDNVLKQNAIHRLGNMEDVNNVIDWLIQPASETITGQVIYLGGV